MAAGVVVALPLLAACAAGASGRTAPTPSPSSRVPVHHSASPVTPPTTPATAATTGPSAGSAVGALFTQGLDHPHGCTATVVDSHSGDVVMTAAHCISGHAAGVVFVPGYDAGVMPFGAWTVTGAFAPSGWDSDANEDEDVAFLTVASHGSTTLEHVVGAVAVGASPQDGERVSITAYNAGSGDRPVRCTTRVHDAASEPTIFCGGFVAGSSGSAWVTTRAGRPTAIGIIGGLHQGGCVDWTSYSPPFDGTETALLTDIGRGRSVSDDLPTPPADGC